MSNLKYLVFGNVKSIPKHGRYLFNLIVVISVLSNTLLISWPAQATISAAAQADITGAGETPSAIEAPLQRRHPYAGVYSVWDGEIRGANFAKYPYLKGVHLYAKWSELKPKQDGPYQWNILDQKMKQKTGGQKDVMLYLQVNAHWPDWVFNHVAQSQWSKRDQRIPQFWDPIYINFYKQFIYDLAQYIGRADYKDQIVLVRAQFNAYTPESIAPDGHYSYQDYLPTPGGHRYQVDYNHTIGDDYGRQITRAYVDAFKPLGIFVVQKPFSNSGHDQSIAAEYVQIGSGLFATNNGPNPSRRQAIHEFSTNLVTRSFSEPGTLGHCLNQPSADALRLMYWSGLSALHQGVEFISFYGCDILNTKYAGIFNFVNKYAGWYREPENSPGAWIAFRDIKNTSAWMTYLEGNYEYLIEQLNPESSIGLFAYPGAGNDNKSKWSDLNELNPQSQPVTDLGPTSQKEGVWARQTNGQPIYLDINNTFAKNLSGEITFRISYLDRGNDTFKLVLKDRTGNLQTHTFTKKNSGQWQEATLTLNSYQFANNLNRGADILLENAGDGDDIFHLVEITRGGGGNRPTPTPPATPPATNTPTPVPTTTPTVPPDTAPPLFIEDFEAGNLGAWSDLNGRQDLKIDSIAALFGKAGLNVALTTSDSRWVAKNNLPNLTKVNVRFYFDPNSVVINPGDNFTVASLAGAERASRIQLSYKNQQYWLRLGIYQQDNNWLDSQWVAISDTPHAIELSYLASSAKKSKDGMAKLWVDGQQIAKLTDVATRVDVINQLALGALRGLDAGTRGNIYFDQVQIATRYIGPELAQPTGPLPDVVSAAAEPAVAAPAPSEAPLQTGSAGAINADLNGDNIVNILDLALIASKYGTNEPQADVDGNATVDIFDLVLVAGEIGQSSGPVETILPEPTAPLVVEPIASETLSPEPLPTDPAEPQPLPSETPLPAEPAPPELPLSETPIQEPVATDMPILEATPTPTITLEVPPTEQPAP